MATANFSTAGTLSLADLQQVVQDKEQDIGPITTISFLDANTMLTFQFGSSPDAMHLISLRLYADHPAQQSGMTLVCAGTCLVGGAQQKVAAYRRTP
ncbi:hypothetical protein [Dyella nitratireducens]|uniref:Uncharacterized protein n=1 Tax=Dyella nitratireducens TaxID=1849580 RepID=A0ABQ1FJ42_9GAMM|nr:hypothetical protein [Dyella nitratireducens]GGA17060.1 hypothetical protein GCM10010981_00980 [Dyella nitratireducens]GLQ44841.1 hypothetical protein GCM10007902_46910 [Dyella nitratireducens]